MNRTIGLLSVVAALWPTACLAQAVPQTWVQSTEIHVSATQSKMYTDGPIFANTYTNFGDRQPNTWIRSDLKPWGVPADAKAAFLSGILIITMGATPQTANLTLTTRRVGDNASDCGAYMMQAVEANTTNGIRSGASVWVPLVNGEFEWCYRVSTPLPHPTNAAYGVNLSVQAWVR